jgi:demethylmenaquinone methyltransferase / 2-methoxy-6-polyprenyl-1,4-benzoquinol methylase
VDTRTNAWHMERDQARETRFQAVWAKELDSVFADVAPYYDNANQFASLGFLNWFLSNFMSIVDVAPGQRVLDVCAGTNAVGIALLSREPSLSVHAIDRSAHMQAVGKQRAAARGFHIDSTIGDVQKLPFPDNHFDVVTLQWATRHLPVMRVFSEIERVLKPGGHFFHCDMLPPANPVIRRLYYFYLHACLNLTALFYRSGSAAHNCKKYFVEAIEMFYTADEMSHVLRANGFIDVSAKTVFGGMIGFHRGMKPRED